MVFLRVLGEDTMAASLKKCGAAYVRFPSRGVNKIWQGCRYGCERYWFKKYLHIIVLVIAHSGVTHWRIGGIPSCSGQRRDGGLLEGVWGGISPDSTTRCQHDL